MSEMSEMSEMSDWHVEPGVLVAYLARSLDGVGRASVEAHVVRCARCRAEVARVSGTGLGSTDFDALWDRIETAVETRHSSGITRRLGRLGIREPDAVVLRETAAQAAQWTVATTVVLALAALAAALGRHDGARLAFLILAPLLPPLGVAASYRLTPPSTALLEATVPYSPARLLLWRTAYVVATAVPAAVAFGAVVPGQAWLAVSWLLPGAACVSLVLLAATWVDPLVPAAAVATGWTALVLGWHLRDTAAQVTTAPVQVWAAAVTVAAVFALHRRLVFLRIPPPFPGLPWGGV